MQHFPLASSSNGSHPPPAPRRPFWERAPRLTCTVSGALIMVALFVLFIVGLAHPVWVLALGALMVAVFGAGLIFWKD